MSDKSSPARPGLPELALGTAVLATDQIRQLAARMQDQLSKTVTARESSVDATTPSVTFDPVHPRPGDLAMNAEVSAEPGRPTPPADAERAAGIDRSQMMTVAVGLASQSVDFVRNTGTRMFDATRARGNRFSTSVTSTVNAPIDRARDAVSNASVRGRDSIAASRDAAARTLRGAMDDSITWAETNIVPRVVDDLMPYLVSNVVPRIIDGAMPQIRQKVIPVVINDLTADPRVRELITEQGRSVLADAADELRDTSATADDAVEASFRKLFHLTPDTDQPDMVKQDTEQ